MTDSITNVSRNIYNHLSDDLSRRVFENAALYSLTGNIDFIRNVIHESHGAAYEECLDKVKTFLKHRPDGVVYYGAGYMGRGLLCLNDNIVAFCDEDKDKIGQIHFGHKVISPDVLIREYPKSSVVITVIDGDEAVKITDNLVSRGFARENIYHHSNVFGMDSQYLHKLTEDQYFDSEIIIPRLSSNEVFVDAGCCNCYTDHRFVERCDKYKKIIAFEPSPKQYLDCVEFSQDIKNITIHQCALWHENTTICFDDTRTAGGTHISDNASASTTQIKAVKLDDILDGEEATFIKMDIEGAELNALKGAEQTILKNRPKLAICVYHKPEDIFEIPAYILSLHSDYKLYLRHYSFWHGETVLYAV